MNNNDYFNDEIYLNELIEAMGFKNESRDQIEHLKQNLREGLDWEIWRAVVENVTQEEIENIERMYPGNEDAEFLFAQTVAQSPKVQEAILIALEEYREEVLNNRLATR